MSVLTPADLAHLIARQTPDEPRIWLVDVQPRRLVALIHDLAEEVLELRDRMTNLNGADLRIDYMTGIAALSPEDRRAALADLLDHLCLGRGAELPKDGPCPECGRERYDAERGGR